MNSKTLIEALCSKACAGRRSGTPQGDAARRVVTEAFRAAGLEPFEQPTPECGGANVLAIIPGNFERYLVVAAHFDHLGTHQGRTFWGADDNAAAVAVLVEVGQQLAKEREGRGVIVAAFDGEEPPFFLTHAMGSKVFLNSPPVPRASIDFMICMDLVGHRVGRAGLPDEVGLSLFALGAELSEGTSALVQGLKRSEPGVVVRALNADVMPPLSDYEPFWRSGIPFLFLSAGRSSVYHTPEDTPEKLDYEKIDATSRWLTRFVRAARVRGPVVFEAAGRADAGTLAEIEELMLALGTPETTAVCAQVRALRQACDARGRLSAARQPEVAALVHAIEARLG